MTKAEILALPLDKLNELVAERVMGECLHEYYDAQGQDHIECLKCHVSRFYHQKSQAFVSDISAAWRVQEKMAGKRHDMILKREIDYINGHQWTCSVRSPIRSMYETVDGQPSAPEAICRAALLAIEGKG